MSNLIYDLAYRSLVHGKLLDGHVHGGGLPDPLVHGVHLIVASHDCIEEGKLYACPGGAALPHTTIGVGMLVPRRMEVGDAVKRVNGGP